MGQLCVYSVIFNLCDFLIKFNNSIRVLLNFHSRLKIEYFNEIRRVFAEKQEKHYAVIEGGTYDDFLI